jgi:PAS domain S-box-containing protein
VETQEPRQAGSFSHTSVADYQAIFEAVNDAILVHDVRTGDILDVNQRMCEMFGYSKEDARRLNATDLCGGAPPCTPESLQRLFEKTGDGGSQTMEWQAVTRNGRRFWTEVNLKRAVLGGQERVLAVIRDISQRKQAEEDLKESEVRFRLVTEGSLAGVYIIQDRRFVYLNPTLAQIFGYEMEEILGGQVEPEALVHPDDLPLAQENIRKRLAGEEKTVQYTFRGRRRDGSQIYCEVLGSSIEYQGRPAIMGTLVDITERVQAEEALRQSEERYRAIVEVQTELICRHLPDTTITFVNEALCRYFGKTRDEQVGQSFLPSILEEDLDQVMEALAGLNRDNPLAVLEVRVLNGDGDIRWQQWTNQAIFDDQGRILEHQAVGRDVTDQRRAEEALRETSNTLQTLIQASPLAIMAVDHDYQVLAWNPAAERIFGWTAEEALGRRLPIIPADQWPQAAARIRQELKGEIQSALELRRLRKDGTLIDVQLWTAPLRNSKGEIIGDLGIFTDISDRKEAEAALQESAANYRTIFNAANDAIALMDMDTGSFLDVNRKWCEMTGFTAEEALSLNVAALCVDDDPEHSEAMARHKIKTSREGPQLFEWLAKTKEGRRHWVEVNLSRTLINGRDRLLTVVRDITERKQTEEAMRASEAKYRTLVEQIPAVTYMAGLDNVTSHIYISPQIETVLGYSQEEWLANPEFFKERIHPQDRDRVLSELILSYSQGGPFVSEYRMLAKSGRVVWVRDESRAVYDAHGLPLFMHGVALDITARKEAEEALREANSRLAALVQASPLAIVALDTEARVISWNPAAEQIFGWRRTEVLGRPLPFVPEVKKTEFRETFQRVLQGETISGMELRRQRRDGAPIDFSLSTAPLHDAAGNIGGIIAVMEDITARKRTEAALRDSEARFRGVFEGAGIGMALVSPDGRVLESNRALRKMSGYTEAEMRRLSAADVTHPDDGAADLARFTDLVAGKRNDYQLEKRYRHKKGHWVWVRLSVSLVRDAAGEPQFAIHMVENITERKRAEEELRRQAELLDLAHDAILVRDPQDRITFWNRGAAETYGWGPGKALGKVSHRLLKTEFPQPLAEIGAELLKQGQWQGEMRHIRRDGRLITVTSRWALRRDARGRPLAILEINRDITERRRAEKAAEEVRRQQEAILSNIPDIAWLKDKDSRYIVANEPLSRASGLPLEALAGKTDLEIWPLKLARKYRQDDEEVMGTGRQKRLEEPLEDKEGNLIWMETIKTPIFNDRGEVIGTTGIARDMTRRRRMEEALRRVSRALKAITECHQAMMRASQETELLNEVCRIIVEVGGYLMAWVGFAEPDELKTVRPVAQKGLDAGYIQAVKVTWADTELGRGPVGVAIRTGEPAICRDTDSDPKFAPWRAEARKRGYASLVALPLKDGQNFGALAIYASEPDVFDDEEIDLLVGLANDLAYGITVLRANAERRRAETALRESEEKYRGLMDYSSDAIFLADPDGNLMETNRRAEELLGYAKEELLQMRFTELHPPDLREEICRTFEKVVTTGRGQINETTVLRKDGARVLVDITGSVIEYAGKKLVQGILRDISARKKGEEALRESELKLRLLTSELLAIQERERRRVSREIHDELGQALTVLKINLVAVENKLRKDQQGLKANCEQLLNYIDGVIENVRRLSWDLSPSILEDLGLSSSLGYLIDETCRKNNLSCSLAMDEIDHLFAAETRINIYRIFQESLTNIVRHAGATHISVGIQKEGNSVSFTLRDNGRGFDQEKVLARDLGKRGLGLTTMNERALMAQGSLSIWSQRDKGTEITFRLPVDN